jgi:hypothetical protein
MCLFTVNLLSFVSFEQVELECAARVTKSELEHGDAKQLGSTHLQAQLELIALLSAKAIATFGANDCQLVEPDVIIKFGFLDDEFNLSINLLHYCRQ